MGLVQNLNTGLLKPLGRFLSDSGWILTRGQSSEKAIEGREIVAARANQTNSASLMVEAKKVFPGGVNSPMQAFREAGGRPLFMDHGKGPYIYDVDGNKYVDYVLGWGSLILGHANPKVTSAAKKAIDKGTNFAAPTEIAVELANLVKSAFPSIELLRFVNSGTEATMTAVRLARAYTGKNMVIKFQGAYHGHSDTLLVQHGMGHPMLSGPGSRGIPTSTKDSVLVVPYNDLGAFKKAFSDFSDDIACVIVEPVAGNMGVVAPQEGFLTGLRELCTKHGAVLIFDEDMTGFRVHQGGAQSLYSVTPDLTVLGKIVGGGLPIGIYGGRLEIMQMISPKGGIFHAGSFNGNPVVMAAGVETLKELSKPRSWERLEEITTLLTTGIAVAAKAADLEIQLNRVGNMFSIFFSDKPVRDWSSASSVNSLLYQKLFHGLLAKGLYIPSWPFGAWFTSLAHREKDIQLTVESVRQVFSDISNN